MTAAAVRSNTQPHIQGAARAVGFIPSPRAPAPAVGVPLLSSLHPRGSGPARPLLAPVPTALVAASHSSRAGHARPQPLVLTSSNPSTAPAAAASSSAAPARVSSITEDDILLMQESENFSLDAMDVPTDASRRRVSMSFLHASSDSTMILTDSAVASPAAAATRPWTPTPAAASSPVVAAECEPMLSEMLLQGMRACGVKALFPWQQECLATYWDVRTAGGGTRLPWLLYTAPTSGGKSIVALLIVLRELFGRASNPSWRALIVVPLRSLVTELVERVRCMVNAVVGSAIGSRLVCGLYGGVGRPKLDEERIVIATSERASGFVNVLLHDGRINELRVVVADELHLIGDPERGHVVEMLLTKLSYLRAAHSWAGAVVSMSATLQNRDALAGWLGARAYASTARPVSLSLQLWYDGALHGLNECAALQTPAAAAAAASAARPRSAGPAPRPPVGVPPLIQLTADAVYKGEQVLIFVNTRQSCKNTAALLCTRLWDCISQMSGASDSAATISMDTRAECVGRLQRVVQACLDAGDVWQDGHDLCAYAAAGVSFHNAAVPKRVRVAVEHAYREGSLRVLVATSTLAAGVNLPCALVIIRDPFVPSISREVLSSLQLQQMAGRAGRTGMSSASMGRCIVMLDDLPSKRKWDEISTVERRLTTLDGVESGLMRVRSDAEDGDAAPHLLHAILQAVAYSVACTRHALIAYLRHSFWYSQAGPSDVERLPSAVDAALSRLTAQSMLQQAGGGTFFASPLGLACADVSGNASQLSTLAGEIDALRKVNNLRSPFPVLLMSMHTHTTLTSDVVKTIVDDTRSGPDVGDFFSSALSARIAAAARNVAARTRIAWACLAMHAINAGGVDGVATRFAIDVVRVREQLNAATATLALAYRLCDAMHWRAIAVVIRTVHSWLHSGCSTNAVPLLQLRGLRPLDAERLYRAGTRRIADIARCSIMEIDDALARPLHNVNGQVDVMGAFTLLRVGMAASEEPPADRLARAGAIHHTAKMRMRKRLLRIVDVDARQVRGTAAISALPTSSSERDRLAQGDDDSSDVEQAGDASDDDDIALTPPRLEEEASSHGQQLDATLLQCEGDISTAMHELLRETTRAAAAVPALAAMDRTEAMSHMLDASMLCPVTPARVEPAAPESSRTLANETVMLSPLLLSAARSRTARQVMGLNDADNATESPRTVLLPWMRIRHPAVSIGIQRRCAPANQWRRHMDARVAVHWQSTASNAHLLSGDSTPRKWRPCPVAGSPSIITRVSFVWSISSHTMVTIACPPPLPPRFISRPEDVRSLRERALAARARMAGHRPSSWTELPRATLLVIAECVGFACFQGSATPAQFASESMPAPLPLDVSFSISEWNLRPNHMYSVCRAWAGGAADAFNMRAAASCKLLQEVTAVTCTSPRVLKIVSNTSSYVDFMDALGWDVCGPLADPGVAAWILDAQLDGDSGKEVPDTRSILRRFVSYATMTAAQQAYDKEVVRRRISAVVSPARDAGVAVGVDTCALPSAAQLQLDPGLHGEGVTPEFVRCAALWFAQGSSRGSKTSETSPAREAQMMWLAMATLAPVLRNAGLQFTLFMQEMPAAVVYARMQTTGVRLDARTLADAALYRTEFGRSLHGVDALRVAINKVAPCCGRAARVNPDIRLFTATGRAHFADAPLQQLPGPTSCVVPFALSLYDEDKKRAALATVPSRSDFRPTLLTALAAPGDAAWVTALVPPTAPSATRTLTAVPVRARIVSILRDANITAPVLPAIRGRPVFVGNPIASSIVRDHPAAPRLFLRPASGEIATLAATWTACGYDYTGMDMKGVYMVAVESADVVGRQLGPVYLYPCNHVHRIPQAKVGEEGVVEPLRPRACDFKHMIYVRNAVVASEGALLVAADYSQIEIRMLAHLSRDATMLDIMAKEQDVFTLIAQTWADMLGATSASHTLSEERQRAKKLVYGMLYGQHTEKLREELNLATAAEAAQYRAAFERMFPTAGAYIRGVEASCRANGYVESLNGRRRHLPDIHSKEWKKQAAAKRQAVNTVCQASAADVFKLALVRLHERLQDFNARQRAAPTASATYCTGCCVPLVEAHIIFTVHDEIVVEAPAGCVAEVAAIMQDSMTSVARRLDGSPLLHVPLAVKLRSGARYGDMQDLALPVAAAASC